MKHFKFDSIEFNFHENSEVCACFEIQKFAMEISMAAGLEVMLEKKWTVAAMD